MRWLITLLLATSLFAADSQNKWRWDVDHDDIMDTLNTARDSIEVLLTNYRLVRDSVNAALEDIEILQDSLDDVLADLDVVQDSLDAISPTVDDILTEAYEIETHLHSYERWLGAAASADGEIHVADSINPNITPFRIDAGDDTWGSWVQILGSSDTPVQTGKTYFDFHKIYIYGLEDNQKLYLVQIAFGPDGATALSTDDYTEFMYQGYLAAVGDQGWSGMQSERWAAGTKVWARCCTPDDDTNTMDFYIGIHEYDE